MRLRLLAALLLLGALRATAQGGTGAFAATLPDGIGDVSRWQLVSGDFDTSSARGEYRFYVNPARPAMYQMMRYRVQLLEGASGAAGAASAARGAWPSSARPGCWGPMGLPRSMGAGGEPIRPERRGRGGDERLTGPRR